MNFSLHEKLKKQFYRKSWNVNLRLMIIFDLWSFLTSENSHFITAISNPKLSLIMVSDRKYICYTEFEINLKFDHTHLFWLGLAYGLGTFSCK